MTTDDTRSGDAGEATAGVDADDVRREWAERSGKYSPEYYANYGEGWMSDSIRQLLTHYVGTDARILEIGCSSGRHLDALRGAGFGNLTGIELNDEAVDVMRERYPKLAETATIFIDDAAEVLPKFQDDAFDAVFTVETLQHIHPDESDHVFDEVARVTADLLITVENESAMTAGDDENPDVSYVDGEFPLYHRNWKEVFSGRGFAQILTEKSKRDTLRAFRRP